MHSDGLANDEAIGNELADGLAGVGVGDLVDLIRVEPNLALATSNHGGGEALLSTEIDPKEEFSSALRFSSLIEGIRMCGES